MCPSGTVLLLVCFPLSPHGRKSGSVNKYLSRRIQPGFTVLFCEVLQCAVSMQNSFCHASLLAWKVTFASATFYEHISRLKISNRVGHQYDAFS